MSHNDDSGILSTFGCKTCFINRTRYRLKIGLVNSHTFRVWCPHHGKVADFELAHPMEPRCDVCGEVTDGSKHVH